MYFEPHIKVYNMVSVYPKSIILGQTVQRHPLQFLRLKTLLINNANRDKKVFLLPPLYVYLSGFDNFTSSLRTL